MNRHLQSFTAGAMIGVQLAFFVVDKDGKPHLVHHEYQQARAVGRAADGIVTTTSNYQNFIKAL